MLGALPIGLALLAAACGGDDGGSAVSVGGGGDVAVNTTPGGAGATAPTGGAPATTAAGSGAAAEVPLEGTRWVLVATTDGSTEQPVPAGVEATLTIADGRLTVQPGCNQGGAGVVVDGDVLRNEPIITTQMACDEARMTTEAVVLAVLDAAPSFRIEGRDLHLEAGDRALVLTAG